MFWPLCDHFCNHDNTPICNFNKMTAAATFREIHQKMEEMLQDFKKTNRVVEELLFKKNGHGTSTESNGNTYTGDWQNFQYHGQGKLSFVEGHVYEGTFRHGNFDGEGKYSFPGGFYEGSFRHGQWDGLGTLSLNGKVLVGTWRNGQMYGQGTMEDNDNGLFYKGTFDGIKFEGTGKLVWLDGRIYEGAFHNGKMDGLGNLIWSNGDMCEGTWRDGKLEGQVNMMYATCGRTFPPDGNYTWSAGDVYKGGFKAGLRHGACIYTFFNGETAQFTWVDGMCPEFNEHQAAVLTAQSMVGTLHVCPVPLLS
jgi:hypothetical protein